MSNVNFMLIRDCIDIYLSKIGKCNYIKPNTNQKEINEKRWDTSCSYVAKGCIDSFNVIKKYTERQEKKLRSKNKDFEL